MWRLTKTKSLSCCVRTHAGGCVNFLLKVPSGLGWLGCHGWWKHKEGKLNASCVNVVNVPCLCLRLHDFIAPTSIKARLTWLKRMLINWEGKSNAAPLTAVHRRLSDFITLRSIKTRQTRVYHSTPSISAGSSRIHDHSGHYPRDSWVPTGALPTGHFIPLFKTGPQGITYRAP